MVFECGQALVVANEIKLAGAIDRGIGQAARAVTPDALSAKSVQTEVDALLRKRPAGVGANASAVLRSVVGEDRTWARQGAARRGRESLFTGKHAIAEAAIYSEDLVVAETWLERNLRHDV